MSIINGVDKDAEVFVYCRIVIPDPTPDFETEFFNHFITNQLDFFLPVLLREPLIIRYISFRQLACPYFIRAAHGQKQFIEASLIYAARKSEGVASFKYSLTYYRNISMLEDWILKRIEVEKSKENLSGADLSDAKLIKAKLSNANLSSADLSDAYLIQANLVSADLSNADLSRAVLTQANLKGINLSGANLTDAYLIEADLQGADFEDAELLETRLDGANLQQVQNLTCEQIEDAYIDKNTQFPDYLEICWTNDDTFTCKINS